MMFLEGIKVLDVSRVLAGPLATQNLADLGASVLKVESPTGDDTRNWGPPFQGKSAAYFHACNRNKASLVLDFKNPADFERLSQLIAVADIVIDNFPPHVRYRWNLDATSLQLRNPNIISLSITGYSGTRCDEPGYDIMVQAEAGFMAITGPTDGEPSKVGVPVVDILTGIMACNGILGALVRRERGGGGAHLEISLFQTALYSLVNVASSCLATGQPSRRWGNAHPNIVPYQPFPALDGQVLIGTGNQRQFEKLCNLLKISDDDIRQTDNAQRIAQRRKVVASLSSATQRIPMLTLLNQLRAARIPCAPILRPDEALAAVKGWDPEALIAVHNSEEQIQTMVASPLRGVGMRQSHLPPPELGQGGDALARQWLGEEPAN